MVPLPTSPSSSSASSSSPRQLHSSGGGGEWHAVVRRNVKSSLLLLLVLSTVFVFSVLHSSHGFGATTADQQALTQTQTQRQSTDHGAVDRFMPGEEEGVPAENNEASEQSSDISLPSANTSAVPAPASSRAEQTGEPF